jgi:hypothetical protein
LAELTMFITGLRDGSTSSNATTYCWHEKP